MTEFGKTELLDVDTLASVGVNIVIYPVTLLRLAMGAAERGLRAHRVRGYTKRVVGADAVSGCAVRTARVRRLHGIRRQVGRNMSRTD